MRKIRAHLVETFEDQWQVEVIHGRAPVPVLSAERAADTSSPSGKIFSGAMQAMDELVAEDYINHSPPPFPGPPGREGLKIAFKIFGSASFNSG